jgi:hypothetical protein
LEAVRCFSLIIICAPPVVLKKLSWLLSLSVEYLLFHKMVFNIYILYPKQLVTITLHYYHVFFRTPPCFPHVTNSWNLQSAGLPWTLAKGQDTFTPISAVVSSLFLDKGQDTFTPISAVVSNIFPVPHETGCIRWLGTFFFASLCLFLIITAHIMFKSVQMHGMCNWLVYSLI